MRQFAANIYLCFGVRGMSASSQFPPLLPCRQIDECKENEHQVTRILSKTLPLRNESTKLYLIYSKILNRS